MKFEVNTHRFKFAYKTKVFLTISQNNKVVDQKAWKLRGGV